MLGAIAGDIIGSRFEFNNLKSKDFVLFHPDCAFTDDSVLSLALAESLMEDADLTVVMRRYYAAYPHAGYGGRFHRWARDSNLGPYNSFGNGSAMRVSPVAWFFDTLDQVVNAAATSACVTHDHPEGVKGAQAVAAAILMARQGRGKKEIQSQLQWRFGYDLRRRIDDIRPHYGFDVSCQGSVPEAILAFLEGTDFEDAVRNAVSLGGDSDTLACMTGGIAEAFFGVPDWIEARVYEVLDLPLSRILRNFVERHVIPKRRPR
ncbi:ADP-ribosylglycohydrolase family protein [Geoalkalibacter sp.]|uniref:ADP-ribosylglycohydrolase family protein n=1 Tax=Geoalkalibacter sp. TaxID=3041440 RepID=UPI00272DCC7C|nr:ADP-ribosylglycohydrolase family protein [Geoalkalibacter sp.]